KLVSGVWLAAAAAVKGVPAFLVLFPLVHRDRRVLLGGALGAVLLLGVVPACFFGVGGTVDEDEEVVGQGLDPGTTRGGDPAPGPGPRSYRSRSPRIAPPPRRRPTTGAPPTRGPARPTRTR